MHRFQARAYLAVVLALSLAACGGGGGGGGGSGSSLSISLSPSSLSATIYQGNSYTVSESVTTEGAVSGPVYVVVSGTNGVFEPIPVQQNGDGKYTATVT